MKKITLEDQSKPTTMPSAAETPIDEIDEAPVKKKFPKGLKIGLIVLAVLAVLGALFTILLVRPLLKMKDQGIQLANEAQKVSEGFQKQDLNQAIASLQTTQAQFKDLEKTYQQIGWTKLIPYFGNFYKDGEHLVSGAGYLLEAADLTIKALEPYADILGFEPEKEGEEEKREMTAEERLVLMLDTLEKIEPHLDSIGEKLNLAREEIDQIDPGRYPEQIRGQKVRGRLVSLVQVIDGTAEMVIEAKPILGFIRPLLGVPNQKKYLLLLQNNAELRPTGGFLTAYATLSVHNGNFKPLGSYDIYSLDGQFGNRLPAPEPIKKYHKGVTYWHLRDMNIDPDFKVFMETFWPNYKKAGGPDVDGVIAVDINFLVDILKVLGPVGVADWGNFSAENDDRCDCPQVFYELELYADKPVGEVRAARKAVIGPLMHSILLNVMQSPKKKWPEFFNVIFKNIKEKHLLFYFADEELQKPIEAINAAGRVRDYDGDYLYINDCNFAGAKSNMFVEERVSQSIEVKNNRVVKTLTIDYQNPYPASDCDLESGGLCLNALLRNWLRVYVPQGSELLSFEGSEMETQTYEELGKQVFEGFMTLRPEGKAVVTIKYQLPEGFDQAKASKLLIQKQPGSKNHAYEIMINGSLFKEFELTGDQEISLSL